MPLLRALVGCWAICAVGLLVAPPAHAQLRATPYLTGLSRPVGFVQDPTVANVQYVVEQGGVIRVVQNGTLIGAPFLSLSNISTNGEQGLLGLAFPPDYGASGRFYICFTDADGNIVVSRFLRSTSNPLTANADSRFDLLWPGNERFISHPFTNHNGGQLVFGADGFLYIGLGDGGSANDPHHLAQNPGSLLGKMLRIDVSVDASNTTGYAIPPSNPFVGQPGYLSEIWSFGLRNPWRWSFDNVALGGTGAMVIGDVGQSAREEIDYEPAGRGGRNYGWRNREGTLDNITDRPPAFLPLTDPIYDYSVGPNQSVTGGFVYRGSALGANYRGRYFFADFVTRRVWSLALTVNGATGEASASALIEHTSELGGPAALGGITSFGEDAAGELYLCSFNGVVYRIGRTVSTSPLMHIDLPAQRTVVTQPFVITGWALDSGASNGTGVSTIHVWALPNPGSGAAPVFVGVPTFGSRPDVGGAFGSQFTPSGFGLAVSGLAPGPYQFWLFGWVDALATFGIVRTLDVTIATSTLVSIDLPQPSATVSQPFHIAGWALDLAAPDGTGINTIHVWAYPTTGGPPVFVGVPALGGARPDVAGVFGHSRFGSSGYNMAASGLAPGTYDLVVFAHSAVTNTFAAAQVVRATVR